MSPEQSSEDPRAGPSPLPTGALSTTTLHSRGLVWSLSDLWALLSAMGAMGDEWRAEGYEGGQCIPQHPLSCCFGLSLRSSPQSCWTHLSSPLLLSSVSSCPHPLQTAREPLPCPRAQAGQGQRGPSPRSLPGGTKRLSLAASTWGRRDTQQGKRPWDESPDPCEARCASPCVSFFIGERGWQ